MRFVNGGEGICALVFDCITGTDVKHQVAVVCKRNGRGGSVNMSLDDLDIFLWENLGTRRVCTGSLDFPAVTNGAYSLDLVFFSEGAFE